MVRFVVGLAVMSVLGGCLPTTAETPKRTADDPCGAEALQFLVGEGYSALASMTFAADKTRFIDPDMAVTQDYRPDRLNIVFDRKEVISRIYCG